jgi:hypothetical protein
MEEKAKLEFTITVNWRREEGSIATEQLGTLDSDACRSAEDVGLQLADAKPIFGRLQEIVVSEQLQRYCEVVRPCPRCHRRRHLKDHRCRRFEPGVTECVFLDCDVLLQRRRAGVGGALDIGAERARFSRIRWFQRPGWTATRCRSQDHLASRLRSKTPNDQGNGW